MNINRNRVYIRLSLYMALNLFFAVSCTRAEHNPIAMIGYTIDGKSYTYDYYPIIFDIYDGNIFSAHFFDYNLTGLAKVQIQLKTSSEALLEFSEIYSDTTFFVKGRRYSNIKDGAPLGRFPELQGIEVDRNYIKDSFWIEMYDPAPYEPYKLRINFHFDLLNDKIQDLPDTVSIDGCGGLCDIYKTYLLRNHNEQ